MSLYYALQLKTQFLAFACQSNQRPGLVVGIDMDNPDIYEVESILNSQASQGRQGFKYLVK